MKARSKLTDEQRKQLEPILAQIEQGFDELSKKMAALGVRTAEEPEGTPCQRCDCESFVAPAHGAPWKCARPNCGHPFTRHDVW